MAFEPIIKALAPRLAPGRSCDYGRWKMLKTARACVSFLAIVALVGLDSALFRGSFSWGVLGGASMMWFFLSRRAAGLGVRRKAFHLAVISLAVLTGLVVAKLEALLPEFRLPVLLAFCVLCFSVRPLGKLWASAGLSALAMSLLGGSFLASSSFLMVCHSFFLGLLGIFLTELALGERPLAPFVEAEAADFLKSSSAALGGLRLSLGQGSAPDPAALDPLGDARLRLESVLEEGPSEEDAALLMRVSLSQCRLERALSMCHAAADEFAKRGPFSKEELAMPGSALASAEAFLLAASKGDASGLASFEACVGDSIKELLSPEPPKPGSPPLVLALALLYSLERLSANFKDMDASLEGFRR